MQMLKRPSVNTATGLNTERRWLAPASLLVLCIGVFFFRLGEAGLINICESFYPASVREMIEANSYIIPQLNYQVYFSKPIMTFWLMAASYNIFGLNDFGGRFAQALMTVILTMACFYVVRKMKGNLAGYLTGAFLVSSPFLLIFTRASSIDSFFTIFLGLTLCAFLHVVSNNSKRAWPLVYICLGLAVLTKGPAALVLFGGGIALSLLVLRPSFQDIKSLSDRLHPIAGSLLFLAVVLPWWIAVGIATKGLFPEVFVCYENVNRYLGHVVLRRTFWWRYLVVIAVGLLPWSLYLPAVFFDTFKNRKSTNSLLDPRVICLSFATVVIAFFSFSSTQLETYVLPACPPLAIAVALTIVDWCKGFNLYGMKWLRGISTVVRFMGGIGLIAGLVAPWFFKELVPWLAFGLPAAGLILAFGFNWQYKLLKSERLEKSLVVMATTMCLFSTLLVPMCIEQFYNDTQKEVHQLVRNIKKTPAQVGLFMHYLPATMYYTEGPVDCFFNAAQIVPSNSSSQKLYIIARTNEAPALSINPKIIIHPMCQTQKWGLYYIQGGTLAKNAPLEDTFRRLSMMDMINMDNTKYGVLTDYYSGGNLNLPERFRTRN